MLKTVALGVAALVAIGVSGCGTKSNSSSVTLGAIVSQTGTEDGPGPGQLLAIQQAVTEINAAGGLLGAPLVVNIQDDGSSYDGGFAAASKLVNTVNVPAIFGTDGADTMAGALAVTVPANIVMISDLLSISDIATSGSANGTVFTTGADHSIEGVILAERAYTAHSCTKAAIIQVAQPVPQIASSGFSAKFTNLGGTITDNITITAGLSSYASTLTQIYTDGPPGCILLAAYLPEAIQVLQDYNSNFTSHNTFWYFLPIVNHTSFLTGVGASAFPPNNEGIDTGAGPGYAAFDTAFKAMFPTQDPGIEEPGTYDDVYAVALAIQAGGKADAATIKANLRAIGNPPGTAIGPGEWAKAVSLLKSGQKINYEGAGTACDFDANGEAGAPYLIWAFAGGQNVTVVPAITP